MISSGVTVSDGGVQLIDRLDAAGHGHEPGEMAGDVVRRVEAHQEGVAVAAFQVVELLRDRPASS